MPSVTSTLSILYPTAPSTVENISVVSVSIKSISFFFSVPKLNSFNPEVNSIIGRFALCD
jgi:hypothetical protein